MADQEKSPDAFARAMEDRRRDPTKKGRSMPDDFASRPIGILCLFIALLSFWSYTYNPISEAQSQAASIDYKSRLVFMQPLFLLMGVTYTIFGESASKVLGPTTKPSMWGWIFFAVAVASGFTYAHFVEAYLQGLGYQV